MVTTVAGRSLWINGRWQSADKRLSVTNPATGETVDEIADGGRAETAAAIAAAAAAWPLWRAMTADRRSEYLLFTARTLYQRQEELARLLTAEQGKPLADARGEIAGSAELFRWYAEEGRRVYGETIPGNRENKRFWVWREPVGVCGIITPWNYPMLTVARKVATALAAGCTMVVKPSTETPLSAVALVRILEESGLPAGVVNLVTGSASQVGAELMANPAVRKISFTGSTEVGKLLMQQAAATVKSLSLELGGHSPLLVFDDADLDRAVQGALTARFRASGQICHSANRLYVQRGVYEAFLDRFGQAVAALKVAPGTEAGAQIGPLINEAALNKVGRHVSDALAKGARLVVGGAREAAGACARGTFFRPTVLADADHDMIVTREETFGPVAPVIPFDSEEEALRLANDTPYGLAAYVFTTNLSRAIRVSEGLEAGVIALNDSYPSATQTPFGGVKESGFGREGGKYGIDEFLVLKSVAVAL